MAVIQKGIIVPDRLMPEIINGKLQLMGLAKVADKKRIVKHLDVLDLKETNLFNVVGISLLVVGIIVNVAFSGVRIYQMLAQKHIKVFEQSLNKYVQAVNNKALTEEIIDELITSIDKLKKKSSRKVILKLSTDDLVALVDCLCNHTQELASANSVDVADMCSYVESDDMFTKFKKNLVAQKYIFQQAA